ncbi:MAG: 2-amino-4-hydroxy-6-hydroxymethyldihydropteridine diphosphokinase [Pelovirga sp.]
MTETNRCRAFIGLGGNLGDPLRCFREVRQSLSTAPATLVVASSPLYRTAPVGGPAGQPDYLNAVIELQTALPPNQLLTFCRHLEQSAGRRRTVRWGPRTLDLDLLFVGDRVLSTPRLTLPHPRLHQRRFVLQPLCDLAAELIHPLFGLTVAALLTALPRDEGVTQMQTDW